MRISDLDITRYEIKKCGIDDFKTKYEKDIAAVWYSLNLRKHYCIDNSDKSLSNLGNWKDLVTEKNYKKFRLVVDRCNNETV